jgi:hypothetical protein
MPVENNSNYLSRSQLIAPLVAIVVKYMPQLLPGLEARKLWSCYKI